MTTPVPGDPFQPPAAPGVAPAAYTINGTISVLETAAVDSDTNDANATHTRNDDFPWAQPLSNPVMLTGHLTFKDQGPEGPNRTAGDLLDVYRVWLTAGQTIELDFSANPEAFDIDLFAYDAADTSLVGQSIGFSRYECLRVVRDGDYYLSAEIFQPGSSGHSVYQLRISAPNSVAGGCAQTTNNVASIIPGEIVAKVAAPAVATGQRVASLTAQPGAASLAMGLRSLAGDPRANRMALLGLPTLATERAMQLGRLSVGGAKSSAVPAATAVYPSIVNPRLPAASRAVLETLAYAKAMQKSGEFAYAFPNQRLRSLQVTQPVGALPPNDRDYVSQRWHYDLISLPQTMQTLLALSPQPTRRPIAAVIDTGIVGNHNDLMRNVVGGYDFVSSVAISGDGDGIDGNPDDSARASTNPSFHGSHVAGTLAAEGFNGLGGLGVAPMAQIMPLRVLGEGGSGSTYDIIQAVLYAARLPNDSGTLPPLRADVINMSLGGVGACPAQVAQIFADVRAQGTVIVAAAGNDSSADSLAPVGVPANCPGVIAVGSVDAQRERAFYSNGGPELAVVAPGGDMRKSTTGTGAPDGVFSTVAEFQGAVRVPTYTYLMGTSMAAPHVAGIVALMRWVNPNLGVAAIEELIRGGTVSEDLGAPGRDDAFGQGLLNAKRAVDAAVLSLGGAGNPPAPTVGAVEASPMNISLGATRIDTDLLVQRLGSTSETVTSVLSDSAAVVVSPSNVDSNGLGIYKITANRAELAVGQVAFARVEVITSTGRRIVVAVTLERRDGLASGTFGPIYVQVLNGDSGNLESVGQADVIRPVGGRYTYSIAVNSIPGRPAPQRVYVIAGADVDNDHSICNSGEACGAYPFLSNRILAIDPRSPVVSGIDFDISPFGGINPGATGQWMPLSTAGRKGSLLISKPRYAPAPGGVSKP